jgi:hypothetical protein
MVCSLTSRLKEKPSVVFSTSPTEKRGFQLASIFSDLKPSKISAHPCTDRIVPKNCVFLEAARVAGDHASMLCFRTRPALMDSGSMTLFTQEIRHKIKLLTEIRRQVPRPSVACGCLLSGE